MFAKCHSRLLIGLAFALALSVIAQAAPLACSGGKIQAGGGCVDKERAGREIDKIVRKIMAENDLKAVSRRRGRRQAGLHQGMGRVDDRRPGHL
jgi:hypothetical protein